MIDDCNLTKQITDLRQRAEKIARERDTLSSIDLSDMSNEELRQALHELQVHQIQLEMQNEELRQTKQEIESLRARYFDLYDMAPVGYCTVNDKGLILEANLTAAEFLGVSRGELVNRPITDFILREDQDIYYLHQKKVFDTTSPQMCELRMIKKDKTEFWAQLASTTVEDADGKHLHRVILSDNSFKVAHAQMRSLWQHKEQSREDERKRIALELHDELGQLLTALRFDLLLLRNDYSDNKELAERIDVIEHYISNTIIKTVQEISSRLRPAVLDKIGLKAAVEWLIDEFRRRNDIKFEFVSNVEEFEIDPTHSSVLFRIIQEALTNVERHAQASSVKILLRKQRKNLFLRIDDNGKGFDKSVLNKSSSLGLLGMRERAVSINGDLEIESRPGKGTSITLRLPIIKDRFK